MSRFHLQSARFCVIKLFANSALSFECGFDMNSFPMPQVYIVYMGEHEEKRTLLQTEDKHVSYLTSVKSSTEDAKASLVYSYKNVINGFSAFLTAEEAQKLSGN